MGPSGWLEGGTPLASGARISGRTSLTAKAALTDGTAEAPWWQ